MKRPLFALLGGLLPVALFAQTTAVPNLIAYQGKVTDANGALIGSPAPVNRTVTFRVWNSPSANAPANRIYSEQQTVTIANGEFSVLIGGGSPVVGETNTVTLANAFAADQRYFGVTIDDGTAAADPEVSPRQQIVSGAFALRAKLAETVVDNSITAANLTVGAVTDVKLASGAVTTSKLAAGAVTGAQLAPGAVTASIITNSSIVTDKLADNAISNAKLADGSVTTAKLADGAVTTAKLANNAVAPRALVADVLPNVVPTANGVNVTGTLNVTGKGTFTSIETSAIAAATGTNSNLNLNAAGTGQLMNAGLPMFACRAWVNFDGTNGTTVGAEFLCNIRASGNVSKVVRTTGGRYEIYFTTPMPDSKYAVVASSEGPVHANVMHTYPSVVELTPEKFRVNWHAPDSAGWPANPQQGSLVIFR